MIPLGECTYAGRKRRKPIQKRRPAVGAETSNPSKRHRDRLNAELDHLASLLPFPPDIISKLDKLSVLRLSVSYLRVKSFFQVSLTGLQSDFYLYPAYQCLQAMGRRPAVGAETSNPSKRHRDRLNAELDHLASLLPFPPDIISKLDKLSVLRLSVSYLRVKSFFQAVQETRTLSPGDSPQGGAPVQEGQLLLESLNGFALVVSAEGMIFYASATIVDYLGFHQTDVMHQNIYDYIHVDDRQDFCRQLHWAMDPPQAGCGQPPHMEADNTVLGRLLRAQEGGMGSPTEYSAFLTRCFICRVRCLLDSTSGFLMMQFQGKLRFLLGQKKKAPSGAVLPPRLALFCTVVPVLLPSTAEMKMKSTYLRVKHRAEVPAMTDTRAKATVSLCEPELHGKPSYLAGRNGENSISMFRAQTDACHWARVPARARCPCLRGGMDLILDSKGATRDREETEQDRMPSGSTGGRTRRELHVYNCRQETPAPGRYLNWTTEKCEQEGGTKLKPLPGRSEPLSMCTASPGSCLPPPGTEGMFSASSLATFRNPPGHVPSAYCGRMSRAWRDVSQGQAPPPACRTGAQLFTSGGYCTEDVKPAGLLMPPGTPCNPMLALEVPIKMENDSGSEDTADGCTPSQVWLGASDVTKRHLVTFPTRMHLKAEPECRHQVYSQPLSVGMLAAHPQSKVTAGLCRELAPFYPAHNSCLELGPPRHFCTLGHSECRAPEVTPLVKREPLDSPPWAAAGQGAVPGVFPKSAAAVQIPPSAPEAPFLL
ncbi:Aryl hydrocarbon receptor repressor [Heterocephalus glaber]|uniref:Aryl hydrocarbon receptor repressor n=1 Tax=Heterocephalus glaber TaxID=10181 RepID=G5BPH0_HETGA|nr:Aryl hydrocarbon receptor repressor [Heterocephalus glaber]